MGISDLISQLSRRWRGLPVEMDARRLDIWIRNALQEESLSQPSSGAWERLRQAVLERRSIRGYGMWVLDEPFRDPPETPPTLLTKEEMRRAFRAYQGYFPASRTYPFRDYMWTHLTPAYCAIVNL